MATRKIISLLPLGQAGWDEARLPHLDARPLTPEAAGHVNVVGALPVPLHRLGKWSHVAQWGDQFYFAELEPATWRNATSPISFICNEIAREYNHGHAISPEEASEVIDLSMLQDAWRIAGRKRNAGIREAWARGMEGWCETAPGVLEHITGSGRLRIIASGDNLELAFYAGPAEDGAGGRHILSMTINTLAQGLSIYTQTGAGDLSLIDDRPDRVAFIVTIDKMLDGEVRRYLEQAITRKYREAPTAAKILAALEELDRQHLAALEAAATARAEREAAALLPPMTPEEEEELEPDPAFD